MFQDDHGAITLYFNARARVAGEMVQGQVDFDLAKAQAQGIQRVRVKLRGAIKTEIRQSSGDDSKTYTQSVPLLREDAVLWSHGSAYPAPGSHVLFLPFAFALPRELPSSFHAASGLDSGAVSYSIEVVGDRPGVFRRNRRLGRVFPVLACAAPEQARARQDLLAGWAGYWHDVTVQDQVRPRPWGSYGHVAATLELPALPSLPVDTPIPFRLRVTTRTKPVVRTDSPSDGDGPLFPAPPADAAGLELSLRSVTHIKASIYTTDVRKCILASVGGLGAGVIAAARTAADDPVWIPGDGAKGVWSRTVVFSSVLVLPCPPTLQTATLSCNYMLRVKVPFPGLASNLQGDIPIVLDSGVDLSTPARSDAGPQNANTQSMGLPPAYWAGDYHDWDSKEKG